MKGLHVTLAAPRAWKEAIVGCGDAGTMRLPLGKMTMRAIINPKLGELVASGADLSEKYNLMSAGKAWQEGGAICFPPVPGKSVR